MGEYKRIFNWKILGLILCVLAFNMILFSYEQLSGRSMKELSVSNNINSYLIERYSNIEPDKALELLHKDNTAIVSYVRQQKSADNLNLNEISNNANTDNIAIDTQNYDEQQIINYYVGLFEDQKMQMILAIKNMNSKLTYIAGYSKSIAEIQGNAEKLKRFTLFSNPKSYSYNNILRTSTDYQRVKDVTISLVNDNAVDKFTDYYYIFYLSFALMMVIIYNLFAERENGMWSMVHGSSDGRGIMAIKRLILIFISSFLITELLYVTTIIASLFLYGGWSELNTPIQTISNFEKFTYVMNKPMYLLFDFLISWFAIFLLAIILWMFFVVFRNRNHAIIIVGISLGIEVLLFKSIAIQSTFSYLKYINIVNLFQMNKIYSTYNNWGFGTHVYNVFALTFFAIIIIMIIASIVVITRSIFMRPEVKSSFIGRFITYLHSKYQKIFIHFPTVFKEIHKFIITGKGLWVIGVVLLISLYFSSSGVMHFTDSQREYDKVYLEHGGKDYSYIIQYIEDEEQFHKEAVENHEAVYEQYKNGQVDLKVLSDAVSNLNIARIRLASVEEYQNKAKYLQTLKDEQNIDGYMISDRGYEQIFGDYSRQREMILLLLLTTGIMLIISECISMEYRTGMEDIVRSCKRGRGWLFSRKIIACLICTSLLFLFVYGIDLYKLKQLYGFPNLNAPIQSLTFMKTCSFRVSILGWIGIRLAVRLLVCLSTMSIAIAVSSVLGKRGNRSITILVLALLIAIIIVLFGVGGTI